MNDCIKTSISQRTSNPRSERLFFVHVLWFFENSESLLSTEKESTITGDYS